MFRRAPSYAFLVAVLCGSAWAGAQWSTSKQLVQPGGAPGEQFGHAVAIADDTIVVGAYRDRVGNNAVQGSASVYRRTGSGWTHEATLVAADGSAEDWFGISVAISGDTVVVGSIRDDMGVNTDQGSAYVFTRSGTTWTQQARITASDGALRDMFGSSVAISGNTVVIGAWNDDVGASTDQGSAYVFTRSGTTWVQQARLNATDGTAGDLFGVSIAMSDNTVVVGAYHDDVGDNARQGSAYVFTRSGTTWTQQARINATGGAAFDDFGSSVAISGNTVVVGAPLDDVSALENLGSAYVFTRSGTTWTQQARLNATESATADAFAASVAISGDALIVGARSHVVGGNTNQGAAYIFARSGTTWTEQAQLAAPDGAAFDSFGMSVAISDEMALVGADADDVDGNVNQGSARVFFRCGADFDHDGFVTGADFDLYVLAFEAGDMRADFDGDGFLTGVDFDLFVHAFEAGC